MFAVGTATRVTPRTTQGQRTYEAELEVIQMQDICLCVRERWMYDLSRRSHRNVSSKNIVQVH